MSFHFNKNQKQYYPSYKSRVRDYQPDYYHSLIPNDISNVNPNRDEKWVMNKINYGNGMCNFVPPLENSNSTLSQHEVNEFFGQPDGWHEGWKFNNPNKFFYYNGSDNVPILSQHEAELATNHYFRSQPKKRPPAHLYNLINSYKPYYSLLSWEPQYKVRVAPRYDNFLQKHNLQARIRAIDQTQFASLCSPSFTRPI